MAEPTDAQRTTAAEIARDLGVAGAPTPTVERLARRLRDMEEHGYARGWGEGWEAGVQLALEALAARPTPAHGAETAVRNHAIARGMRPEAVR